MGGLIFFEQRSWERQCCGQRSVTSKRRRYIFLSSSEKSKVSLYSTHRVFLLLVQVLHMCGNRKISIPRQVSVFLFTCTLIALKPPPTLNEVCKVHYGTIEANCRESEFPVLLVINPTVRFIPTHGSVLQCHGHVGHLPHQTEQGGEEALEVIQRERKRNYSVCDNCFKSSTFHRASQTSTISFTRVQLEHNMKTFRFSRISVNGK